MFKIHVNDGQNELPTDDIFYVVAKDGIYIKKTLGIMDSLVPVKNISTLDDIQSTARMNIKKIPGGQFAQIISFFKEVHKEYRSEAIVLLFYHEERKVYKVVPPAQKVSSAALDYDRGLVLEGWIMVGDIHSHASMSAFHSGTDHADELSFDGLHITLGNMGDDHVSISASIVSNGHRVIVNPEEYVSRLIKTKDIDESGTRPTRVVYKYCVTQRKMIEDEVASSRFGTTAWRRLDKRYTVDISKKYFRVPKGWMDMVEHQAYHYQYGHGGMYASHYHKNQKHIDHWSQGNQWGYNYNPNLWKNRKKHVRGKQPPHQQLKLLEAPEEEGVPSVNDSEDVIPCISCKFKEFKLLVETNEIEEEDHYQCMKCDGIWEESTLIDGEQCPICITGDFLFVHEEDTTKLHNEYVPADEHDHLFVKDDPIEVKSDFVKCGQCGETFRMYSGESKCPFCYTLLTGTPPPKGGVEEEKSVQQEDMENQMRSDSGEFLGEDTEAVHKAAKTEIDNILAKIPDPAETQIPLPETSSPAFATVRDLFQKVFKRE